MARPEKKPKGKEDTATMFDKLKGLEAARKY
jgi:hypothetical protein